MLTQSAPDKSSCSVKVELKNMLNHLNEDVLRFSGL